MKKFLLCTSFILASFAPCAYAQVSSTTGFIPGQIWYSKEPLVEGDTVTVYTAVWNGDPQPLSARVEFYDKNVILGVRDIVVPKTSLQDVSISWKVTAGDHTLSAKIISSSVTLGSKKESITLDRAVTSEDRQFVAVVIKKVDGAPASSADVVKSQVDKAGASLDTILPQSVSKPLSDSANSLDTFRDTTYTHIASALTDTKKYLESTPKKEVKASESSKASVAETKPLDATEKPIAYIKLFFLTVLGFVFGNKLVFYGIIAFIVFVICRAIFRRVRDR